MRPATVDLTVMQGDDWTLQVTVVDADGDPVDLSASTFASDIKTARDRELDPSASRDIDDDDAAAGVLVLTVDDAVTADLAAGPYFWDLQRTDAGTVTTLARGKVTVLKDVTV